MSLQSTELRGEERRDSQTTAAEQRVLVITGLSRKNRRHYGPLAAVAGTTTLVALDPEYDVPDTRYVSVPEVGPRPLRLLALLVVALLEAHRNEYDAVAAISLFPYGLYALVLKAVFGLPAHLGIIGIDLDHHAKQWYGPVPRWLFRRFEVVSVPGTDHAARLAACGVASDRIAILTNPIDTSVYRPGSTESTADFIWVGRFSPEKDPRLFVRALAVLAARGYPVRAVMVGDGPLASQVRADLAVAGLEDCVSLPGWVDDPLPYYRDAAAFVCTSERDALPLVLLEAMATGLVPIVPRVGSISDVVTDGENGLVCDQRSPTAFADAMARQLEGPDLEVEATERANALRDAHSLSQASQDWARILSLLAETRR